MKRFEFGNFLGLRKLPRTACTRRHVKKRVFDQTEHFFYYIKKISMP